MTVGSEFCSQKEKTFDNGHECPKEKGNCPSSTCMPQATAHTSANNSEKGWVGGSRCLITQHVSFLEDHLTPGLGVLDCGVEKVLLSSLSGLHRSVA